MPLERQPDKQCQLVVVLEESPCRRLGNPRGPIYKSLSLSLDHKILGNCQGICILQTVRYVSYEFYKFGYQLTATVHEVTVKNGLVTDI